ncbi:hypothetical protein HMPREF9942_00259 [Fusobacterium animalis F0419]|uniref:DUF5105 domain-containing protein n=1 Tax=Fusobacterium animalis F0419 TaxID=999414 RepID=H1HCQ8_9FUSO|nr:DUF5105 domain-containing protein [Fusobacterium animalis]EHO79256.1 hypothetical protein HMPREF9942_00259 [Fusobacterium animalis F0419]
MKKFLKFVLIGMSVLFLVSCGKPDSQKAFESSFKLLASELEKQVPNDDPVTKSFAKAIKKATYKVNKVTENGDTADIDVTIKGINIPGYMGELMSSVMPLAMSGAPESALDAAATKFFDDLFKRSDLSYVEKNLIVKMQKEDGEWKIVNFSEVLGAALGGLDKLFENEEAENNSN